MSKKSQKKWVGVDYVGGTLLGLLTGKARMKLPKDAEIVHVRAGEMYNIAEFLVRSEEYPELQTGERIPIEVGDSCEKIMSISSRHAHSLYQLVKYLKEMIEQGQLPTLRGSDKDLTISNCDELIQDLEEGE